MILSEVSLLGYSCTDVAVLCFAFHMCNGAFIMYMRDSVFMNLLPLLYMCTVYVYVGPSVQKR